MYGSSSVTVKSGDQSSGQGTENDPPMAMPHTHQPVLLSPTLDALSPEQGGIYIDATFGRGGHSQRLLQRLSPEGKLIAFDKDPQAIAYGQQHLSDPRCHLIHAPYNQLGSHIAALGYTGQVQGILFDCGVSSPQLDDGDRGFSFLRDGPLDMRMDTSKGLDAATWINNATEQVIQDVLKTYGEERFAKSIARAIVTARREKAITSTLQLANIIAKAHPRWEFKKHPATRSFQGIRIHINNELKELEEALSQSLDVLAMGGRIAVISFHSLEDRIVKTFIKSHSQGQPIPKGIPIKGDFIKPKLRSIGKVVVPDLEEIQHNPRARSAKLRIAEKIS